MDCFDGVQVDVEGLMKVDEVMANDKKGEADGVASPLEEVKVVVGRWAPPPLENLLTPLKVSRTMIVVGARADDWMNSNEEAFGAYCWIELVQSH